MKILTLNCGSSSIKFDVIETDTDLIKQNKDCSIVRGIVEKIGLNDSIVRFNTDAGFDSKKILPVANHTEALKHIVDILTGSNPKILNSLNEINGVGHRVVHGGEAFSKSVIINNEVLREVEACSDFAPLHNPQNLKGISVAKDFFPNIPHIAVFDTGFHYSIPDYTFMYPLPYELYTKHKIRRYGFHGTSHRYVTAKAIEFLGLEESRSKIVTLHLGNGCSAAAVLGGKSIDTSMGHTPLEGLMMGTRTGDIDPAVVIHIMNKEKLSAQDVDSLLNKKSGFLGVSGLTNDLREIEEAREKGHKRATLAIDMYCYRLKKYIGAYMSALGGADAIVFTGGIGENSSVVRELSTNGMEFLGIKIENSKNNRNHGVLGKNRDEISDISTSDAKVKTIVIPTNEELMIARDTVLCIRGII
ncbi:MAG: acetate kinase [Oligoflexia bacterium]|nr:acetate kinase [Oligoflexia bacterium]